MSASFAAATVWGLLILAAFIGWGGEIAARIARRSDADAGLQAAWGMAFTVFAGGVACLFGVMSRWLVLTFVGAGAMLAIVRWIQRRGQAGLRHEIEQWHGPAGVVLLGLCVSLALVQYLFSIGDQRFNPNDDFIAYFPFAKQILEAGTLFDPFSTRRVMSLGGQSVLHAVVLAGVPSFRLHLFDAGICTLVAVLLVIGDHRAACRRWSVLLALLILITLPSVRINTYPEMSGVVIFYGLYRTLAWLDEGATPSRGPAAAAVVALTAAAACTLRSNYFAVAVPLVGFSYACFWLGDATQRSNRFREAVWCAGLAFLFLIPWMLLSFRSSGTPLFPLLQGNFNDAFPMLQDPRNLRQQWADLVAIVRQNRVFPTFPLLILAAFLVRDRGRRAPIRALLLSSLVGWVSLVAALASDVPSFVRYVYGFMIAGALAVIARSGAALTDNGPARRISERAGQVVAVSAGLAQMYAIGMWAFLGAGYAVRKLPGLALSEITRLEDTAMGRQYHALQSRLPPKARLLVMVDYPFLFDFRRNEIYNVDTAAAVSPRPGWPYFGGPRELATYLRGVSVRHVAFVTPDTAVELFRRDVWLHHRAGRQPLWRAQAPYYLDVFDNIEELGRLHPILYHDGSLVLVDLTHPTSIDASPPRE